jgi:phosphatidylglycerophosphate synthase
MQPFTPQEIDNAKHYKYNGADDSILAKLFLRTFWNWAIEFVPMWVAPNLITFIGFLFELSSFLLSFVLSHVLTTPLPRWVCIWNGISLFVYQTLDNLDGRQARRTGSSSPLGQFFDHGCDALTGVIELIKVAAVLDFGCSWTSFGFVFLMGLGFFLTSYEEYVTHAFHLPIVNGPDEGLLALVLVHVIVGIAPGVRRLFASAWWSILFIVMMAGTVTMIFASVVRQSIGDRARQVRAVVGILPSIVTVVIVVANLSYNHDIVHSAWFIMSAGFILQFQSQQAIVAHLVLRPPVKLLADPSTIALWVLALVPLTYGSAHDAEWYWRAYFAVAVALILVFDVRVVYGLSTGLEIPVFTIRTAHEEEEVVKIELDEEIEEPPEPLGLPLAQ